MIEFYYLLLAQFSALTCYIRCMTDSSIISYNIILLLYNTSACTSLIIDISKRQIIQPCQHTTSCHRPRETDSVVCMHLMAILVACLATTATRTKTIPSVCLFLLLCLFLDFMQRHAHTPFFIVLFLFLFLFIHFCYANVNDLVNAKRRLQLLLSLLIYIDLLYAFHSPVSLKTLSIYCQYQRFFFFACQALPEGIFLMPFFFAFANFSSQHKKKVHCTRISLRRL